MAAAKSLAWATLPQKLSQVARESTHPPILSQPVRELAVSPLPAPISELPWGHNRLLLTKLTNEVGDLKEWGVKQIESRQKNLGNTGGQDMQDCRLISNQDTTMELAGLRVFRASGIGW